MESTFTFYVACHLAKMRKSFNCQWDGKHLCNSYH